MDFYSFNLSLSNNRDQYSNNLQQGFSVAILGAATYYLSRDQRDSCCLVGEKVQFDCALGGPKMCKCLILNCDNNKEVPHAKILK